MKNKLTQSQLLLWTGQQMHPNTPLYNMIFAFDIAGAIDEMTFQQAFQELIRQSDALRTVFQVIEGAPQQTVLPEMSYQMDMLDWSNQEINEGRLEGWLAERNQRIFDLSVCLFDSALIKLSKEHYIWYSSQHHLISDAWSASVLYKTMSELYALALQDKLAEATPIPLFQQYIFHENKAYSNGRSTKEYWQEQSAGLPPSPRLYGMSDTVQGIATTQSERIVFHLGAERSAQLRQVANEPDIKAWTQHLSLFNIFATVLFSWLNRISGQQELAISTPAHNRPTPDFKNTPGVFIELFPLRETIQEDDTFGSLFQRVRNHTFEFLKHAESGLASPELNKNINVVLNYVHATFEDFNGFPTTPKWLHPDHADPGHALRLQVVDFKNTGEIQLYFDVNSSQLPKLIKDRIASHFISLLDAFIADRSQSIYKESLVYPEEHRFIQQMFGLDNWNDKLPNIDDKISVLELFHQQVEEAPDAVKLVHKSRQITNKQLNDDASQLAAYLQEKGLGAGDRVAIYTRRSIDLYIGILAAWKLGASYIPIATDYPAQRANYMLNDAEAAVLLTHGELGDEVDFPIEKIVRFDKDAERINKAEKQQIPDNTEGTAYIMYTSGSTGQPKGVVIEQDSLSHYIQTARLLYTPMPKARIPLFTSIGFDLTVTSLFIPLIGDSIVHIYEENDNGPDLAVLDVVKDNQSDFIKLTPSHLALLRGNQYADSAIKTMIVGGEDFRTDLAISIQNIFPAHLKIYNEYGPTEATVGCVLHQFELDKTPQSSVPVGRPMPGVQAFILDKHGYPVPQGVIGELHIAGKGLAKGYWNREELTKEKFITDNPLCSRMYKTGDLARLNEHGSIEYLGRVDRQIKLSGRRIELGEIEAVLNTRSGINNCAVVLKQQIKDADNPDHNCIKCGLPSNYPTAAFDENGVCNLCTSFETYQERARRYFKTPPELQAIFDSKKGHGGEYDCLALLSGGKDSTYVLGQLVEMGLKPLAFTLDNGYISEQAKDNIRRVVKAIGVDHVFGTTPAMDAIFVDSLQRHKNVCNGCFKTIYTLSTQIALEKKIPFIVTGLSRGQFFETRLTEELFWKEDVDIQAIDDIILNARKAYHKVDDAVNQLMDVSMFEDESVFEKVQYVDFYRYTDVSLDEMLEYLDKQLPWVRPTDTGRSTNCLINQVGIFVHKKEEGYSNYAFPYSWDVRIGHKTREASLDEINEAIDEREVRRIMAEIGYEDSDASARQMLVAYYTGEAVALADLKTYLAKSLPEYMIPVHFVHLDDMPLSPNGKIDRKALPDISAASVESVAEYVAAENEFEEILVDIWQEVLNIERIGTQDNFLALGGTSLAAIRLAARMEEAFELEVPVNKIFELPTIAELAADIESTILMLLEEDDKH